MLKKILSSSWRICLPLVMALGLAGCGSFGQGEENTSIVTTTGTGAEMLSKSAGESDPETSAKSDGEADTNASMEMHKEQSTQIQVFVAASLKKSMEEVAVEFQKANPSVKVVLNADSSGKLMTQIQEGFECDVFFSAAQKQMDTLEAEQLVIEGTRKNVLNNQLAVISLNTSDTKVTGMESLNLAKSIALADGSVPVGRYTRIAMHKLGILPDAEDVGRISTKEVSEALGNVEISEQSNVSKVLTSVAEGQSEVGTVYYSDTYGYEDRIRIIEKVDHEWTGKIIYPIACIRNEKADALQSKAASDFVGFVTSDDAKLIFEKYYFGTDVQ